MYVETCKIDVIFFIDILSVFDITMTNNFQFYSQFTDTDNNTP
jgi:hypothetical protein